MLQYQQYHLLQEGEEEGGKTVSHAFISVQERLDDIQKVGFYSDFQPQTKLLQAYQKKTKNEHLLIIRDHHKVSEENWVWCNSMASYEEYSEKLANLREICIQEWEVRV